jgi:ABC-type transport system involved in multi-copper enzyme maturation permease subunit
MKNVNNIFNTIQTSVRPIGVLAYWTCLEAYRARAWLWLITSIVMVRALGELAAYLALTDAQAMRLSVCAPLYRLGSVGVIVTTTILALVRERESGFLDMLRAQPLANWQYLGGRFLGFILLAVGVAVAITLSLIGTVSGTVSHITGLFAWGISLAFELILMSSLALFIATGLRRILPALAFSMAFYILARSWAILWTLAMNPIGQDPTAWTQVTLKWLLLGVGIILPSLSDFTQSPWLWEGLTGTTPSSWQVLWLTLWPLTLATLVYCFLFIVAACWDIEDPRWN